MDLTVYPVRRQIRGTAKVKVPTALFFHNYARAAHASSLLAAIHDPG